MKRYLVWGMVGLLLLAMTGIASATVWQGTLDPGDYVTTPISNVNDVQCKSKMTCMIPTLSPIPHQTWVTHGMSLEYLHSADLMYNQTSYSSGSINYGTATLHWRVGTAVSNGYSLFVFVW
ncbi:hypothetical protein KQI52_08820 [bacterium]|nr:hypothetical protein [bacterium]